MTKEELESKFEDCFDANTRSSVGGYGPDVTDRRSAWLAFEPIISEYAKQQAIAFGEWIQGCDYAPAIESNKWQNQIVGENSIVTTEYLHDRFIEQQTNK